MPRKKDNLIKTIHLRVSEETWNSFEQFASKLPGLSFADTCRLALAMFIRRGGADYKEKD